MKKSRFINFIFLCALVISCMNIYASLVISSNIVSFHDGLGIFMGDTTGNCFIEKVQEHYINNEFLMNHSTAENVGFAYYKNACGIYTDRDRTKKKYNLNRSTRTINSLEREYYGEKYAVLYDVVFETHHSVPETLGIIRSYEKMPFKPYYDFYGIYINMTSGENIVKAGNGF